MECKDLAISQNTVGLNMNEANEEELAHLPMVGRLRAEFIIQYRSEHGPFKSWDDLRNAPDFDDEMIQYLKCAGASLE